MKTLALLLSLCFASQAFALGGDQARKEADHVVYGLVGSTALTETFHFVMPDKFAVPAGWLLTSAGMCAVEYSQKIKVGKSTVRGEPLDWALAISVPFTGAGLVGFWNWAATRNQTQYMGMEP